MADIEFTSEIKLDTAAAEKSLVKFSEQINSVFRKTNDLITSSLSKSDFGFRSVLSQYEDAIAETDDILDEHKRQYLSNKRTNKNTEKKLLTLKSQIGALRAQYRRMAMLAPYDTTFGEIDQLRIDNRAGRYTPQTALGKYNYLRSQGNGLVGTLYYLHRLDPITYPRELLEYAEGKRDINRDTGNTARAQYRASTKDLYQQEAAENVINYMLDTNERLSSIASKYGVSFTRTQREIPENLDERYTKNMQKFLDTMDIIEERKQRIDSGNLSKSQRTNEFKYLGKNLNDLVKVGKALGGETKKASEAIRENTDLYITEKKAHFAGEFWKGVGATALLTKALAGGSEMLESYWGERVTRNVYASKQAYYKRWETGGSVAGVAAGAGLGFAIGGPIGAAVGAAIGGVLGPLYGKFKENEVKANMVSSNTMMGRVRNRALYGSNYNSWYAAGVDDMGFGAGGMSELANNAMSLRAKMMLGQVGEYDMLYYSMMPNYYAALMNGITGPELAKIYQNDLSAIGDPSMRYVVGQAIGGQNAFAMVNNPYFDSIHSSLVHTSAKYNPATDLLESGFVRSRSKVANENIMKNYKELVRTAMGKDEDFFKDENIFVEGQNGDWMRRNILPLVGALAFGPGGWELGKRIDKDIEGALDERDKLKATTLINVIVLPDGTEIARDVKTADEYYMNGWSQYSGG